MTTAIQSAPFVNGNLTQSEAELYDRQIRLWGIDAQNRIRASNILIVGISGLGAEIAKNLILAGPRSVTLMDDCEIGDGDSLSQFLFSHDNTKKNRAEASYSFCHRLNPLVKLEIDTSSLRDKSPEFCEQFNLVILIDQDFDVIDKVNIICRKQKIAFISGGVFGWIGYGFFDFTGRDFLIKKPKIQNAVLTEGERSTDQPGPSKPSTEVVTLRDDEEEKVKEVLDFSSFVQAFDVSSKNLPRRLRMSIPRSYFLIKTLLKYGHEHFLTNEILEQAYRHELDANSHFSPEEEIFNDYQLFTGPQLGATCAVLGGFIGQEAIKALSQTGEPLRNVMIYSALDTAFICNLPPK